MGPQWQTIIFKILRETLREQTEHWDVDPGASLLGMEPSHSDHYRFYIMCLKADLTPEQYEFVDRAYNISKFAHRDQMRQGGDRYFEHPKEVARILLTEAGVVDHEIIAAALLHDVAEDSHIFGSFVVPTQDLLKKRCDTISHNFSERTGRIVYDVSKDVAPPNRIRNREKEHQDYCLKLYDAGVESILVKAADRLHNLRTLRDTPVEKQLRKVAETEKEYLPLFERHAHTASPFQKPMQILLEKITFELESLKGNEP